MRYLFAAFFIVGIFIIPWISLTYPDQADSIAATVRSIGREISEQFAAVILAHKPVTVATLKSDYDQAKIPGAPKVRVLIVPGHEPDYGGAEYSMVDERDLNVELAANLIKLLQDNGHYEVSTTRYENSWTAEFDSYFKGGWDDIIAWQKGHKDEIQRLMQVGKFDMVSPSISHNNAPKRVATRLHGINKWANENNIDISIHIHFNDYPRNNTKLPGKYSGFSIYVPEKQYYNSTTTKAVAESIAKRLKKYNPVSDLPGERGVILEDQDLIALGSYNSVDAASMLIEYSYIYEPQILDPAVRSTFLKELAYETYLGVVDFFDPSEAVRLGHTYDTFMLPYHWDRELSDKDDSSQAIFALQTALVNHSDYPPEGSSLNECPRTGKFGPCTKKALAAFQKKLSISGEAGIVGPRTLEALNRLYSMRIQ